MLGVQLGTGALEAASLRRSGTHQVAVHGSQLASLENRRLLTAHPHVVRPLLMLPPGLVNSLPWLEYVAGRCRNLE